MKKLLVAALFTLPAVQSEAVVFKIKNCWWEAVQVYTYNSNDTVYWVPFGGTAGTPVARGSTVGISCATDTCKVKVSFRGESHPAWANYTYASDRCVISDFNGDLPDLNDCRC